MKDLKQVFSKVVDEAKTRYQHIFSAALIILLVLIVYINDFSILVNEAFQSEAFGHVLLIPFFVGFLLFMKKDTVKAILALETFNKKGKARYIDELVGVALCLVAFLLYWYGSYTFYALEYHILSIPIFVMGMTLILLNLKALKVLIFPILFLLFLIPIPAQPMYIIGGSMANFNTQASYSILKTLGLPVTLNSSYGPPTITVPTPTGQLASFGIDLACSGIYTFVAFAMFASFLTLISLAPPLKKISVFVFGFIVFEVLNVVRITSIVSVGYWFGEEIAMSIYHAIAGLLFIFFGMFLVLIVVDKIMKIQILPTRPKQAHCPKCKNFHNSEHFCFYCGRFFNLPTKKISQRFWVKLFLLLLGCFILTSAISAPTFAIAQGSIELTAGWQSAGGILPSNITDQQDINYTLDSRLFRDEEYEKIAHLDASLTFFYLPPPRTATSTVYVTIGVSSSISNLHSWEVCLVAVRTSDEYSQVAVIEQDDIQLLPEVPLVARYFLFKDEAGVYAPINRTQVTLYWYTRATFRMGFTVQQKYVRISLIIYAPESTTYQSYKEELLVFGQIIAAYWEPLKSQSILSLGVPAQQSLLAFSIAFVALAETAQYSAEWRKKSNNLEIFRNFAPVEEKAMLQIILDLAKEKKAVKTQEIYKAIKKHTGKSLKYDKLIETLNNLEECGFLKRDIVSVKNVPELKWKTYISNIYKSKG